MNRFPLTGYVFLLLPYNVSHAEAAHVPSAADISYDLMQEKRFQNSHGHICTLFGTDKKMYEDIENRPGSFLSIFQPNL